MAIDITRIPSSRTSTIASNIYWKFRRMVVSQMISTNWPLEVSITLYVAYHAISPITSSTSSPILGTSTSIRNKSSRTAQRPWPAARSAGQPAARLPQGALAGIPRRHLSFVARGFSIKPTVDGDDVECGGVVLGLLDNAKALAR
jgi:hypothetical protein